MSHWQAIHSRQASSAGPGQNRTSAQMAEADIGLAITAFLRPGGLGTDAKTSAASALLRLQGQAGNRAVQTALQRQGPATPAPGDAQQWDQDWALFPRQQRHFKGSGRPAGDPRARYDVLAQLYKAHGIARPLAYLDAFITAAKFYGFSIPAHADLAAALAKAEAILRQKGVEEAPVRRVWALNARTTSSGGWSNHADGRAVDIDPVGNPHIITSRKERRLISLMTGIDFDAGNQGYDAMKAASGAFTAAYNPAGIRERIRELTAAENQKREASEAAAAEEQLLLDERKRHASPGAGLVKERQAAIRKQRADVRKARSDLKKATEDRRAVERQLTAYEAADGAVALGSRKKRKRKADPLRSYAATGFLSLSKDVVEAMGEAGLKWGGNGRGRRTSCILNFRAASVPVWAWSAAR
jgi:hypothetical protein